MALEKSAGEDSALRRRRLRYRAWHRGTREMDLVLGPFADAHIEAMPEAELQRLEGLMSHEDTDLLMWVMARKRPRRCRPRVAGPSHRLPCHEFACPMNAK